MNKVRLFMKKMFGCKRKKELEYENNVLKDDNEAKEEEILNLKNEISMLNDSVNVLKEEVNVLDEIMVTRDNEYKEFNNKYGKKLASILIEKFQKLVDNCNQEDCEKLKGIKVKAFNLDSEGWAEFSIAEKLIKGNISEEFPYEDNNGYFEFMNGKRLTKWQEKIMYSEILDSGFIGVYEKCSYSSPKEHPDYKNYRRELENRLVRVMIEKHPFEFIEPLLN